MSENLEERKRIEVPMTDEEYARGLELAAEAGLTFDDWFTQILKQHLEETGKSTGERDNTQLPI